MPILGLSRNTDDRRGAWGVGQGMISTFLLFVEEWRDVLHLSDAAESSPVVVAASGLSPRLLDCLWGSAQGLACKWLAIWLLLRRTAIPYPTKL